MAPIEAGSGCTTRRRSVRSSTRKTRRSGQYKKRVLKPKNIQETPQDCLSDAPRSNSKSKKQQDMNEFDHQQDGCSTPKAERFRIPEIVTCPPAPKKQRLFSNCSTLHRSPIAFFASPDIELFFFVALSDHVSV